MAQIAAEFFDHDGDSRFLGIGSILDDRHDRNVTKIVAGSGYGGYEAPPTLDETWNVRWVRGPQTARLLELPSSLALGDPGSLVPLAGLSPPRERRNVGFMPHFESAIRGDWQKVSTAAGVTMIDPRGEPAAIIAAISLCRVMMSEALHGIIVADALRVPWIAIQPLAPIHRPKWFDWAETLDLSVGFHSLCPSTALERAHLSPLSRYHAGRTILTHNAGLLRTIAKDQYVDQATGALHKAAAAEPRLSRDTVLDRAQSRMMEAIAALSRMSQPPISRTGDRLGMRRHEPAAEQPLHDRTFCAYLGMPGRLPA